MLKLGSHVGMSGKKMMVGSVEEAISYEANTFMLYTGAPQNTRRKELSELNIEPAWELMRAHGIDEFIVHAPYIINLGNTVKPETYEIGVEFLEKEIRRTAAMGGHMLVLHPGAHVGEGVEAGLESIVKGLNEVFAKTEDVEGVYIALETMAGKGTELGRTFEELKAIYDGVNDSSRLRVCFDTCHTNDAGYDLVNNLDGVLDEFDRILGLNQIGVLHINDSKNPLGAHKDRHENIGKGYIGFETLYRVVHSERLPEVPRILETPWVAVEGQKDKVAPYKEEIALLRN